DWMFSAVLALVFLITGVIKAFRYEQASKSFLWVKDMPPALVQAIGIAEVLGAVGLILPAATGFYAWLTPVAAVALGLLMVLAAGLHLRRHEGTEVGLSVILLLLLAFVAYVRWPLVP
ncbi:MAG: DoxX family protein, partial [Anaerolineae bacterium]